MVTSIRTSTGSYVVMRRWDIRWGVKAVKKLGKEETLRT